MEQKVTTEQVKAAISVVVALGQAIRDLKQVPEGELYARLMSDKFSLTTFNLAIEKLVEAKLIRRSNHLLIWIGDQA